MIEKRAAFCYYAFITGVCVFCALRLYPQETVWPPNLIRIIPAEEV